MNVYLKAAALLLAAAPQSAQAQDGKSRSASEYVCILSGQCQEDGRPVEAQRRAAPEAEEAPAPNKRFSLPKQEPGKGSPPVALNSFSLAPRADLRLNFQSGSATLTKAATTEAKVIASALRHPALIRKRFRIEGHTDSVGGRASNLRLSQRRADAVVAELVRLGVARNRLVAKGYSFDRPLPGRSSSSPENRRVEAVAIP